jgi:hypothetical protein
MKYFNINRSTTPEELKSQMNTWAKKLHPDTGLAGSDEQFKEMKKEYEAARITLKTFEQLRETDEHGKLFLHGLADYLIDRVLKAMYPRFPIPKLVEVAIRSYKESIIEKLNASEIIAGIEEKIKQYRNR